MGGRRLQRHRLASYALLPGLMMVLDGCASSVVPSTVTVLQGRLVGAGLLDQQLQMVLCLSNPNDREIALSHVSFQIQLEDDVLANGESEAPLLLSRAVRYRCHLPSTRRCATLARHSRRF